jgi:rhodanese-related sulfurtransferase
LLVDVREVFEYKGKRIRDAVNIPSSGNLDFASDTIDKEYALFFYCTTDYRSNKVARFFYDKGFRKLYSLDGGIARWKKEGMEVEKRKKRGKD